MLKQQQKLQLDQKQTLLIQNQKMENWMSKIDNKTYVSQLSIPGTHNSAAYKTGANSNVPSFIPSFWWKCQQMSFQQQLKSGIRYFDLRIRYYPTDQNNKGFEQFHFHHDTVYLGSPDDAMLTFSQFLKSHPQQFLILQIQQEHSPLQRSQFGKKIYKYFQKFNLPIFNYSKSKQVIPTIGQLRGKIWLIQACRVKLNNQFWIYTGGPVKMYYISDHFVIQNAWNDPQNTLNWDSTKQRAIKNLLDFAFNPRKQLKINFISWSAGKRGCHNNYFQTLLKNYSNLGISIMDYPSKQLIKKIINKNFKTQ